MRCKLRGETITVSPDLKMHTKGTFSCSLNNVISFNYRSFLLTRFKTASPIQNNNNNKTRLTLVKPSGASKRFLGGNFGTRTECLFKTDVRLINCQIKGSEKGKD